MKTIPQIVEEMRQVAIAPREVQRDMLWQDSLHAWADELEAAMAGPVAWGFTREGSDRIGVATTPNVPADFSKVDMRETGK